MESVMAMPHHQYQIVVLVVIRVVVKVVYFHDIVAGER
jgi:hypothetical protein